MTALGDRTQIWHPAKKEFKVSRSADEFPPAGVDLGLEPKQEQPGRPHLNQTTEDAEWTRSRKEEDFWQE